MELVNKILYFYGKEELFYLWNIDEKIYVIYIVVIFYYFDILILILF